MESARQRLRIVRRALFALGLTGAFAAFGSENEAQAQRYASPGPHCVPGADGFCVPTRHTYGYYGTNWRRWPGADQSAWNAPKREPIPTPAAEPEKKAVEEETDGEIPIIEGSKVPLLDEVPEVPGETIDESPDSKSGPTGSGRKAPRLPTELDSGPKPKTDEMPDFGAGDDTQAPKALTPGGDPFGDEPKTPKMEPDPDDGSRRGVKSEFDISEAPIFQAAPQRTTKIGKPRKSFTPRKPVVITRGMSNNQPLAYDGGMSADRPLSVDRALLEEPLPTTRRADLAEGVVSRAPYYEAASGQSRAHGRVAGGPLPMSSAPNKGRYGNPLRSGISSLPGSAVRAVTPAASWSPDQSGLGGNPLR